MLLSWGIVKGASPALCLYAPLTKANVYMPTFTYKDAYAKLKRPIMDFDSWRNSSATNGLYTDDDYLSEIAQYSDKSWYSNLLTNPWLAGNQSQFSPNIWQQLGEQFGDTQARDNYNANLKSQRSQWLSEFIEKMRQQDYDSASSQVEREKAAGLNPDLNGNITPGGAAENDQPMQSVNMPSESVTSDVLQLGNTILTTAMQFYSSFQSIRGTSISNRLNSLGLTDALKESTWSAISDSVSEVINAGGSESLAETLFDKKSGKFVDSFTKAISDRISRMPYSRSNKRAMRSMINDLIYSTDSHGNQSPSARFETLRNNLLKGLSDSRSSYAKSYGAIGAGEDSAKQLRWIGKNIYRPINELALECERLISENNKNYHTASKAIGLPYAKAGAELSDYRLRKDIFNIKKNITGAFQRINKKITGSSDLSPAWKLALEAGVSSAEALILSKLSIH